MRKYDEEEIYAKFLEDSSFNIDFNLDEWPYNISELDESQKKQIANYSKENTKLQEEHCIKGQYFPSNYSLDEISVHYICLKLEGIIFQFSDKKKKQYAKDIETYKKRYKNSINYEKSKKYDEQGYKK
ncbi:hypothetical protein ACI76O_11415 [Capnocytophaga cynodegmi]|uniref:hypothetical protein n=1 Tax=Capnocytophaga cynodegmi TaxID=28189 RepID=UPI00385BD252